MNANNLGGRGTMSSASSSRANGSAMRQRHDASSSSPSHQSPRNGPSVVITKPARTSRSAKGKERAVYHESIGYEARVKDSFRKFGEHVARNQIRTLLIDCLVMTNLFYPSLALYLQKRFPPLHPPSPPSHNIHRIPTQGGQSGRNRRIKKEHPLSLLSTPILDSFFPYPPPLLPRLTWAGWWGRDTGQQDGSGWSFERSRLAIEAEDAFAAHLEEEIRVMRIGWADVGDVLDRSGAMALADSRTWSDRDQVLLKMVIAAADEWQNGEASLGARCVRHLARPERAEGETSRDGQAIPTGPCYVLSPDTPQMEGVSPLSQFHHGSEASRLTNETAEALPFNWEPNAGNIYHSMAALFHVPRENATAFDTAWGAFLSSAANELGGEIFVEAKGPANTVEELQGDWVLSYASEQTVSASAAATIGPSHHLFESPPLAIWVLYLLLFSVLGHQLSNASKVHSRFGLAFTGIVQLCCSSVMSFSVLALRGWNGWGSSSTPTTLPTYILPFVIVIVGAENMSTLTRAVFSIPFTSSVPVRIGLALSKVGARISLTSLTDLVLLCIVWLCVNLRPVREFCVFAGVVIVTDWFMLHTFFLTILSIDAQRLELADVLASGAADGSTGNNANQINAPVEMELSRVSGWRKILRARSARVGSFIFLLSSVGLLYYLTERRRGPLTTAGLYGYSPTTATTPEPLASPTPYITLVKQLSDLPPAQALWRALNPSGWRSIRVAIPSASIIVLPRPGHTMAPADLRKLSVKTSRLLLPRLKPLFYLFKVVVLPQAVTATALYMLLLYLLKDADLLDAQRNRLGRGDAVKDGADAKNKQGDEGTDGGDLADRLGVHMLPCSHSCDIDILATSQGGQLVISIGLDNTLCLWRFDQGEEVNGTREMLVAESISQDEAVVKAAFDALGSHAAVLTREGVVQVWKLPEDGPAKALPSMEAPQGSYVLDISFEDARDTEEDPFTVRTDDSTSQGPAILLSLKDGSSTRLTASGAKNADTSLAYDSERPFRLLAVQGALQSSTHALVGTNVTLVRFKGENGWNTTTMRAAGGNDAGDRVTALAVGQLDSHTYHAIGYRSGACEITDETGNVILERSSVSTGPIKHVWLVSTPSRCSNCKHTLTEGFFLVASTTSTTFVTRVSPRGSPLCRCAPSSWSRASFDESSSLGSSKRPSPQKPREKNSLVVPPNGAHRSSPDASPARSPGLAPPVSNGEFPLSSHGTRRLSTMAHRDEFFGVRPPSPLDKHAQSAGMFKSMSGGSVLSFGGSVAGGNGSFAQNELEMVSLGGIRMPGGGAVLLDDTLVGLRKSGAGIDDAVWQVWTLDLTTCWNGSSLTPSHAPLHWLVQRTLRIPAEMSMRDRRAERLLSLSGRATFSNSPGLGNASPVPTYSGLGYVAVGPMVKRDERSLIATFGNRLGVIKLPPREKSARSPTPSSTGAASMGLGSSLGSGKVAWSLTSPPPSASQGPPPARRPSQTIDSRKTN